MAKNIGQLIKEATEAVKDVPDILKTVAFEKAFEALQAEQQGDIPAPVANRRRSPAAKSAPKSTSQSNGNSHRSQLDQLDRTGHSEITQNGSALVNSLRVLRAARDDLRIDGLSASDITHILVDKFRCRISRQAVSQALNDAGQLVNRHKEGNAIIFRLMSRGEEQLDALDAGGEVEVKPASKRKKKFAKKTSQAKAPSNGAAKKEAKSKRAPGALSAVTQLYEAGFFSKPRSIAAIIEHLKHSVGRAYKPNQMSPALLRYLRSGKLTRLKNADNQYEYQNA